MNQSIVEGKLREIYEKHNPHKVNEIPGLLLKYAGKEDLLLQAVKKKYKDHDEDGARRVRENWSYTLKHFDQGGDPTRKQRRVWNVESSLSNVQAALDELAESIGGECHMRVNDNGNRALIVRRKAGKEVLPTGAIVPTVEKMRNLIHSRYRESVKAGRPADAGNEHERRKLEKQRDQKNKGKRDRNKRYK